MEVLEYLMVRKRKPASYLLDELIYESIKKKALEEGSSANRWLESHLFNYFKSIGVIDENETRIPEGRGGDRKSKTPED